MSNKDKKLVDPDCARIYEAWIEKRGEINTSFKRRWAVLFENGELVYYEADEEETAHKIKGIVDLVNVEEIRPHPAHKGIKFTSGWEIQQKKRTYKMASANDEERDAWIKRTQDVRDRIIFKKIQVERVEKENERIQKANNEIKQASVYNTSKGQRISFLTQSNTEMAQNIQHSLNADITDDEEDIQLELEQNIDEKTMEMERDEWIESEIARYSNMEQIPLPSLHRVATLRIKNGCFGYQYRNICMEKKQDLIISNEFLQIGIGDGLAIADKEIDDEDDEKDAYGKDTSADISHNGELRTKIQFIPSTDSFTICCYVYLLKYDAGNTIISNKYGSRQRALGFEFMISPNGKVSAFLYGHGVMDFIEIGTNALELYKWHYIVIVVNKLPKSGEGEASDDEKGNISTFVGGLLGAKKRKKKKDIKVTATDICVYVNGELDGKLSFSNVTDFNVDQTCNKCVIGSCIDLTLKKSLCGKISNVRIYEQRALNEDEISRVFAQVTAAQPGKQMTFSYIPSLLQVEIPHKHVWKYNGKLYEALPEHCHIHPKITASFTITAWVICSSLYCGNYEGSVIVSNLKSISSQDIIQKHGFELLYPTKDSNVLSVIVTSTHKTKDIDDRKNRISIPIGRSECVLNEAHLISVSVHRLQDGNTLITSYINGQEDGVHRMKSVDLCGGTFCSYFARNGDKYSKGQFKGAIANVRYFDRALTECEIACIYVADQEERLFKKKQIVLYNDYAQNDEKKKMKTLQWMKGIITECDYNDSELLLKNVKHRNGNEIRINLSQVEILKEETVTFIDLSRLKQNRKVRNVPDNLGGLIHGRDFNGNKWKLFVGDKAVLRHLMTPSSLTLLQNGKAFPKHDVQRLISNKDVDDELIINRLLEALYALLRDINVDTTNWDYIHKYIFGFDDIWSDKHNFMKLKACAKSLQSQYTQMQFDLFNELKLIDWKIFDVNDDDYTSDNIERRQDAFAGGMSCELDDTLVSNEMANEYDIKVVVMSLWGRNYVINENFQKTVASFYEKDDRFDFYSAHCKTYERMMEKTAEYQAQGERYPAAFRICNVLRCSVICCNLDDVYDALQILNENIPIIGVQNRFSKDFDSKETDGYRDVVVNVLFQDKHTDLKAICEIQLHLKSYLEIKKKLHKYQKIIRAVNCKTLLRTYENT